MYGHAGSGINVTLKSQVYFPGNSVEGFVQINAPAPMPYTAIRVKLTGKEKARMVEERGVGEEATQETLTEIVVVHKHLITLAGQMKTQSSAGFAPLMLPPGNYTYPFSFPLPNNAPPSFHFKDDGSDDYECGILYYVKAYIDTPNGRNAFSKDHFTVLQAMPKQQWLTPSGMTEDKFWDVTCCCCIPKGKLSARLFCDRTTISLDRDQLVVCADVNNEEGENEVESFEISLFNKIELRVQGRHKTKMRRVGHSVISGERGQVEAGGKGRFIGTIPLVTTQEGRKNIIPTAAGYVVSSTYVVKMEMNIPGASDPEYEFPVIFSQAIDESNFLPPVTFDRASYPRFMRHCPPTREDFYQPPMNPVYGVMQIPNAYPPGWQPPPVPPPPQMYSMAPPAGMYGPPTGGFGARPPQQMPQQQQVQWTGGAQYQAIQPPPVQPLSTGMGTYGAPSPYTPLQRGMPAPGGGIGAPMLC